jgi:hypothetical protein
MISRAPLLWDIRERVMTSKIKAPPEQRASVTAKSFLMANGRECTGSSGVLAVYPTWSTTHAPLPLCGGCDVGVVRAQNEGAA